MANKKNAIKEQEKNKKKQLLLVGLGILLLLVDYILGLLIYKTTWWISLVNYIGLILVGLVLYFWLYKRKMTWTTALWYFYGISLLTILLSFMFVAISGGTNYVPFVAQAIVLNIGFFTVMIILRTRSKRKKIIIKNYNYTQK